MKVSFIVLVVSLGLAWALCAAPPQPGSARSAPLQPGHEPVRLALDLAGSNTLVLTVTGRFSGQAIWGEPLLFALDGSQTRLVDLKPVSTNVPLALRPAKVDKTEFAHAVGANGFSVLEYALAGKFARFEARVGLAGSDDKRSAAVFEARNAEAFAWQQSAEQLKRGFTRECLASLRHAAQDASAGQLEQQVDAFEKDFDSLRAAIENDPQPVRERLKSFVALVRQVRTLRLDGPLLFVKRHAYFSPHIYDDYIPYHAGGGIYVIENPRAPMDQQVVRAVIDSQTKATCGEGVYRDPDLSPDAKRMLFAHKNTDEGNTSVYEIALDGTGLRRLTDPSRAAVCSLKPEGLIGSGAHDYSPAYLPDGRIVFLSTRTGGLVMCFNNHIATLHTMNADGSDIRPISANHVTEFDPTVLPDGRILYGRWEYVDKTALYMQSLWTVNPDGTQETALFKNNLPKPTAVLDARPVPDSPLIVASLTPHNGQSVGAIAMLDPRRGKNNLAALSNFTPEYPTEMDQGLTRGPSDPWPLDEDTVIVANNAEVHGAHGVLELIDRFGFRFVLHREPDIGCFSPMLVKAHAAPANRPRTVVAGEPGKFLLHDVYQGLSGVKRGEVKWLRVLETTSRISGVPSGGRWWNQAFLVSWQGSYDVKNFLGVVPVEEDGSAYFEAPPGKALYVQALDKDKRLVQSMRTFVQSMPGVTRSCQGCHVPDDDAAPVLHRKLPLAALTPPAKLQPESWGNGFLDYTAQVQPILDRNCTSCHGGEKGIDGGLDLTGGWTWAFNLSYETLLKNTQTGFLNCVNSAVNTSYIQPPRTHGSGAAPLGRLLLSGHGGRISSLSTTERDLLMAWMDGNCNFNGTWDFSENATVDALLPLRDRLVAAMKKNGCTQCHQAEIGSDWVNLQRPELSRMLRAPMTGNTTPFALGWCRDRKAPPPYLPLITQRIQPPDVFHCNHAPARDGNGNPVAALTPGAYRELLAILAEGREEALAQPRADMPGARIHYGVCRQLVPTPLPEKLPRFTATASADGAVKLSWTCSADLIGLMFEIHRSNQPGFAPSDATRIVSTAGFEFVDDQAPAGPQYYALLARSGGLQPPRALSKRPSLTFVNVPSPRAPGTPPLLAATPLPGEVELEWKAQHDAMTFNLYRADGSGGQFRKLNPEPLTSRRFRDENITAGLTYRYALRSVSRRGIESAPAPLASITALPDSKEPVFVAMFSKPTLHDGAKATGNSLILGESGYAEFPHCADFDLRQRFSVECWVRIDEPSQMPVVLSCGSFNGKGWFLQRFGRAWRWHLGGQSCDGGQPPATGTWTHLAATFDGKVARLFQDGAEVAARECDPVRLPCTDPLRAGQYVAINDSYQVHGQIAGVKIYRRALTAAEVTEASQLKMP